MLKNLIIFSLLLLLMQGCAGSGPDPSLQSVEMGDMGYLTHTTYSQMLDCININDRNACEGADGFITKHPWLLTGEVNIVNSQGMSKEKWDVVKVMIRKNLYGIKSNYPTFKICK